MDTYFFQTNANGTKTLFRAMKDGTNRVVSEQYHGYLEYLAAGNVAEVKPPPPEPTPPVKIILRSDIINRLESLPSATSGRTMFDEAFDAINLPANGKLLFKWNSMVEIKINDPLVTSWLQGIGVDISKVLY